MLGVGTAAERDTQPGPVHEALNPKPSPRSLQGWLEKDLIASRASAEESVRAPVCGMPHYLGIPRSSSLRAGLWGRLVSVFCGQGAM